MTYEVDIMELYESQKRIVMLVNYCWTIENIQAVENKIQVV